eukprot:3669591-Pleurochrysis_carterae.AAC.1
MKPQVAKPQSPHPRRRNPVGKVERKGALSLRRVSQWAYHRCSCCVAQSAGRTRRWRWGRSKGRLS